MMFFLPFQDIFVQFLNDLHEVNEFLEQSLVVFCVIDELCNIQHFFETSGVEKIERPNNPHHWFLRDVAQINAFQHTFFPN